MTNNHKLSYEELLDLTNAIKTEVCNCLNGLSPDIINDITAVSKHRCNTRHCNLFVTDWPKTDRYGKNSILYRTNQI